jgi:hypothetical protein
MNLKEVGLESMEYIRLPQYREGQWVLTHTINLQNA